MRNRIRNLSTAVLRAMERWLDDLPDWVMPDFRAALKDELLARDLPLIAEDVDGFECVAVHGIQ